MSDHFTGLDWAVVGGYGLLLLLSGIWVSRRKQRSTEDYFLGGRSMPVWAVAVSVLATSLSAATFIGGPQQSYAGNLTYLSSNIGMILGAVVVASVFVPVFYKQRVGTVYELLETRFGPRARTATSAMYMLGRIFASGARVYIAALPLALILFWQPELSRELEPQHLIIGISAMVVVGIIYTLVGGIASVIWTDVLQTVIFVGAAVAAALVLLSRIPASPGEIIEVLAQAGEGGASKVEVLRTGLNISETYTIWTALIGFTIFGIAAYGTDQDLTQRVLTCRSAVKGSRSVLTAIVIGLPVTALFMLVGLLLFVFYQRPDVMGDAAPDLAAPAGEKVFTWFIVQEMPPGITGLMIAGLFAAGLSTLNSALNAMSSTLISDVYRKVRPDRSEKHYVNAGRLAVVGWGIVLGLFAIGCVFWRRAVGQTLIDFALEVMTFAYAGLAAVFLTAMLTRRGSERSVIAGLIVGFFSVAGLSVLNARASSAPAGSVLADWQVAFPWQLTIGTALAMAVCCLGRPREAGT